MPPPNSTTRLHYVYSHSNGGYASLGPGRVVLWSERMSGTLVVRFWTPQEAVRFARLHEITDAVIEPVLWNYYHKTAYPGEPK